MSAQSLSPGLHCQEGRMRLAAMLQAQAVTSSSSVSSSAPAVTSPFSVHTTQATAGHVTSSDSRLTSSTLYRTLAAPAVSSSLSAGHFVSAQTQPLTTGQTLAKLTPTQSQNQAAPRTINASAFPLKPLTSAQNSGLSQSFNAGSSAVSFLQVASPRQHFLTPAVSTTTPQPQPQSHPLSPQMPLTGSLGAHQQSNTHALCPASPVSDNLNPGAPSRTVFTGPNPAEASSRALFPGPNNPAEASPLSSYCASSPLDTFLSPSPAGYDSHSDDMDPEASPCSYVTDTNSVAMDADSGYSDNIPDGKQSSSPDKAGVKNENQTSSSPTKRKRARKSRAKPHDPVQKVIVKRTRRVRANDRERSRMHGLNDAMDDLRQYIPQDGGAGKMTKIDTLRTASNYIRVLNMLLGEMDKGEGGAGSLPSDMMAAVSNMYGAQSRELEKGEEMTGWPSDMMSTLSSLFGVQPQASPDSTDGHASPQTPGSRLDDGRLQQQSCGVVSSSVGCLPSNAGCLTSSAAALSNLAGMLPLSSTTPFPGYHHHNDGFNVVDSGCYNGVNVLSPPNSFQSSGHFLAPPGNTGVGNTNLPMMGEHVGFSSVSSVGAGGYQINDSGISNVYGQHYIAADNRTASHNLIY